MFTGITENTGVIKSISKIEPIEYKIETSHAFNRCKNRIFNNVFRYLFNCYKENQK